MAKKKKAVPKSRAMPLQAVVFGGAFALIGTLLLLRISAAGTAQMSLTVDDALVKPNDLVTVSSSINTDGETINAAEVTFSYDDSRLEFVSIDTSVGDFGIEAAASGSGGTVNIAVGETAGVSGSNVLIGEIVFRALSNDGVATIAHDTSRTNVILRSSDNTDILGTLNDTSTTVDATEPDVTISAPADGSLVSGAISLSATVTDNNAVDRVEFFVDGVPATSSDPNPQLSAPYTINLDTMSLSNGSHSVYAVATDTVGNQRTSGSVQITVDNLDPTVSLTSPSNNARVNGVINVAATASDDNAVSKVEFYEGSNLIGEDLTAPYQVNLDTLTLGEGQYQLTARAIDTAGNSADSGTVTIQVDYSGPNITVTAPTSGAEVGDTFRIQVSATDPAGVTQIEFLIDGSVASVDTTAPYQYDWYTTTESDGPHTVQARATDTLGNTQSSAVVAVNVDNSYLPSDINQDGITDIFDLSLLLSNWRQTTSLGRLDINGDGIVDIFDLSLLLSSWRQTS